MSDSRALLANRMIRLIPSRVAIAMVFRNAFTRNLAGKSVYPPTLATPKQIPVWTCSQHFLSLSKKEKKEHTTPGKCRSHAEYINEILFFLFVIGVCGGEMQRDIWGLCNGGILYIGGTCVVSPCSKPGASSEWNPTGDTRPQRGSTLTFIWVKYVVLGGILPLYAKNFLHFVHLPFTLILILKGG